MILILIMSILLTPRWFPIPEIVQNHPVLVPLKQDLISSKNDIYTIVAGRRSFKTETVKRFGTHIAYKNENNIYHFGAPTRQQAKEIWWDDLKALIHPVFIKDKSETELKLKIKQGAEINVVGLKEFSRREGGRSNGLIVTEFQDCDVAIYTQTFEPMLNDTGGFAIFEGRPHGKNHLYDFYQMGLRGEIGCGSYHWTSATVLTEAQILKAKSRLGKADFEREYEASFETGGISPYYAYSTANNKRLNNYDVSELNIMCDFNATEKPMSWVISKTNGNEDYLLKDLQYQHTNTETMCDILDEELRTMGFWDKNDRTLNWYGDYAGKHKTSNSSFSDWDLIEKKFASRCKFNKRIQPCKSIVDSIAATNSRLCNTLGDRKMFVNPDECKNLIEDWEKGQWKSNGRELDDKDPKRGHLCRAVDYFSDYEYPVKGKPVTSSGRYA